MAPTIETAMVGVNFADLGEGNSEDYDPTDPEDYPHLRLDVLVRTSSGYGGEDTDDPEWQYPQDGSICTSVDARTPIETQLLYLAYAAGYLSRVVERDESVKHAMDRLSWMGESPRFEKE